MLRLIIYALIFGCWAYAISYDVLYIPNLRGGMWMNKLVFLTNINFVLMTVYFGLCLIRAFIDQCVESGRARSNTGPHRKHPAPPSYFAKTKLHTVCDFIYATSAFPVGMAVCILFWSIYAVDRELVFPKWLDQHFPRWYNHMLHTAPLPFMLVDTLLVSHRIPRRRVLTAMSVLLAAVYFTIIFCVYYIQGWWLYPIMEFLSPLYRALFFAVATFLFWLLFMLCYYLNGLLWGGAAHIDESTEDKIGRKKMRRD